MLAHAFSCGGCEGLRQPHPPPEKMLYKLPQAVRNRKQVNLSGYVTLKLAPTLQGTAERSLVGIFEIPANR